MATPRMPVYFVPHGAGPCFFMDWNPPDAWDRTRVFLEGIAGELPETPRAIVLISAHWLAPQFTAASAEKPALIFDYHGVPPHTYQLRYDAPGAPALSTEVAMRLARAGLPSAQDPSRGFDHGVFVPLKVMFPQADIPVLALSLHQSMDPAAHLAAGKALEPLREQGVLILGSGMSFHNMRGYGDPRFGPVSDTFDQWLARSVALPEAARIDAFTQWEQAPASRLAHPLRAEEHLLPLLVAAGAAGADAGRKVFSDRVMETTISGFRFG